MKRKKLYGADLFCGAGGTSQGLLMAANDINADLELIAVNHWQTAIDTHTVNHPYARNLCTGLDEVDPLKLVPGRRLHILCASPECTHHSVARGGKPMDDQSRSSPQLILRWMQLLYIDNVIIENVPEFQSWGPLGVDNQPLKSKKGALFNAWVDMIRAMDYRVEWRVLNCADYGAPTTRRRLFMICRKRGKKIVWPEPTHVPASSLKKHGQVNLFAETRKPWRTAREIIDWQRQSHCIFDRKRPLAPNTQRRIQAGLRKFSGIELNIAKCYEEGLRPYLLVPPGGTVKEAQAFLLPHRAKDPNQSIEDPFRTVTATSSDFALVEPFLMTIDQTGGTSACVRSADDPLPTLVTKANAAVCEPFLIGQQSDAAPRHSAEPVPTIATAGAISLTEPHIIPQFGTASAASVDNPLGVVTTTSRGVGLTEPFLAVLRGTSSTSDIDNPVPTVTNSGAHYAAVEPFMVPNFGEREGQQPRTHSVHAPVPAVTGHGAGAVVEPFIATVTHSGGDRVRSIDLPLATVTRSMGDGVAAPALVSYYGTQNMSSVDEPTPTVTTKDRFGLMQPQVAFEELLADGWTMYRLEVRFRMLQPRELARAQGFDDSYQFTGNREAVVKQIGNAVPPPMARALCAEVLQ